VEHRIATKKKKTDNSGKPHATKPKHETPLQKKKNEGKERDCRSWGGGGEQNFGWVPGHQKKMGRRVFQKKKKGGDEKRGRGAHCFTTKGIEGVEKKVQKRRKEGGQGSDSLGGREKAKKRKEDSAHRV